MTKPIGTFTVSDGEREFAMRFTTARMLKLHEETGKSLPEHMQDLATTGTDIRPLVKLIAVGIGGSEADACDAMDAAGGLKPAVEWLRKAAMAGLGITETDIASDVEADDTAKN